VKELKLEVKKLERRDTKQMPCCGGDDGGCCGVGCEEFFKGCSGCTDVSEDCVQEMIDCMEGCFGEGMCCC
jgi:hypothetical protein